MARLLTLQLLYHFDHAVGRYIVSVWPRHLESERAS
jgi:hypothetical protein